MADLTRNEYRLASLLSGFTTVRNYSDAKPSVGVMMVDGSIVTTAEVTGIWENMLVLETENRGTFRFHSLSIQAATNGVMESDRGEVKVRFLTDSAYVSAYSISETLFG